MYWIRFLKQMKKINLLKKNDLYILLSCLLCGGILSWLLYDTLVLIPLFAFCAIPVKKVYAAYIEKKKKSEIERQFADFLYYISISFSLGRNMIQGMEEALINLKEIYSADAYLVKDIEEIVERYKRSNIEDVSILERNDNEDIRDFVKVYENCKETGGNLVEAIGTASRVISEKIQVNREIVLQSSQRKMEGRIIAFMPVVIIAFLKLTGPDYLEVMYTSLAGRIIMSLALVATIISWVLVEKITKVCI